MGNFRCLEVVKILMTAVAVVVAVAVAIAIVGDNLLTAY